MFQKEIKKIKPKHEISIARDLQKYETKERWLSGQFDKDIINETKKE